MSQNTVFCPACGEKVTLSTEYETKFCPYCGGPLPTLPDSSQVIHSDPVPDVETSTASTHSEPEPTVSHEPVAMNSEPFHPSAHSSQSGKPYNNTAAESAPPKDRGKLIVRWYLAIIAWAVAFAVLLYIAEEVLLNIAVGIGLLILISMPFWYTRFHPDAKRKKGVALKWSLIMIVLIVLISAAITIAGEL